MTTTQTPASIGQQITSADLIGHTIEVDTWPVPRESTCGTLNTRALIHPDRQSPGPTYFGREATWRGKLLRYGVEQVSSGLKTMYAYVVIQTDTGRVQIPEPTIVSLRPIRIN